ncbi:MAG: enoyl-CoA hydratase/isomerase family protein [Candidatus Cyclobacteriaceae bacterium M2_1C_046]
MELVKTSIKDRIGFITLNRPDKRNALSFEMVSELKKAFHQMNDADNVKVIILNAEGSAFCAGADLGYLQQLQTNTYEENLEDSRHLMELFQFIYTMPKVVIAAVQGHAIAGGCGLATVCDFAFSVPEAKFGYTEVRIGFIPAIVKVFLLRKIGEARAKLLLLSGELISAEEAMEMGLISGLIEADEFDEEIGSFARELVEKNSGQSMGLTKQMIANVQEMSLEDSLKYAADMNAKARATEDCKRGIAAFLNKEKISW